MLFAGSGDYWEDRYAKGGDSGVGSYGRLAEYKAEYLNRFVAEHDVQTVVELGCGDGHQLGLATYPHYLGLDVSPSAIERCQARFGADPTKEFALVDAAPAERFDLALSLDVVYHLVEDAVFERYMQQLFTLAGKYAIIYSSDRDEAAASPHVRHRRFSTWIEAHAPAWKRIAHEPNRYPTSLDDGGETSHADFFVYAR